jgi:hypothetical protein
LRLAFFPLVFLNQYEFNANHPRLCGLRRVINMKAKFLVTVILLATCLSSWAWHCKSITPEKLSRIRIGQTTEPDLVELFGPPSTRFVDIYHRISLDWFRSVPMPIGGYLPFIGELAGGRNVEAQQLSVFLTPDGRVVRYEMHSSLEKPRADPVSTIIEQHQYPDCP